MSVFAFARRCARVGVCVLVLGATGAAAQQAPSGNPVENSTTSTVPAAGTDVKPAASQPAQPPAAAPAPALPELVVDAPKKKVKKAEKAKEKEKVPTSAAAADTATQETPPPGVTLGTSAPSDTGTSTFDASNVKLRTDGSGDANTFMRNLPNVQYQNQSSAGGGSGGGATSQKAIDTKPELLSISGGKTYENNFILNGVSVTNIGGPIDRPGGTSANELTDIAPTSTAVYGMSPQTIYVPSDFIGTATVIDSNASAEYGQFQGGVVLYDLMAPPTDRYHASVSASRNSSEWASYILAAPAGNPYNRQPPPYEKTNLSASVGAPITSDFAFIAQVSRKEAQSQRQKRLELGSVWADENSDNIFGRIAATVRTDIGKFTFDSSRTDYFQHWVWDVARDAYLDTNTHGTSTQIKYETKLAGLAAENIGLGEVKLTSRTFYNTSETQNNSNDTGYLGLAKQRTSNAGQPWAEYYNLNVGDWCPGVFNPQRSSSGSPWVYCYVGGFGDTLQSQTDFGAQATLTGHLLLGQFNTGIELKQYEGRRARLEDFSYAQQSQIIYNGKLYSTSCAGVGGLCSTPPPTSLKFKCDPADSTCTPEATALGYQIEPKYDTSVTLNAVHTFAEVDQTWKWFNLRAGVRVDYDDYFEQLNLAPRLAGTVTPVDGLSFTIGYNRYYLGETLYYALRDKVPGVHVYTRSFDPTTGEVPLKGTLKAVGNDISYRTGQLVTPYDDEYTAAVGIRDPLLGGQIRLKYLERYGHDQFSSKPCAGVIYCYTVSNDGDTKYRAASAEYTKEWHRLNNPFYLNAAAVTGNVTWSEQAQTKNNYLVDSDLNGDGYRDTVPIRYNGEVYRPQQFGVVTGNLDIPVRFGATLATRWFNDALELNATAGINLGFQGVAPAVAPNATYTLASVDSRCTPYCQNYVNRQFGATLNLDVSGQINVTEQAAIQFSVNNLTDSDQNAIVSSDNPWVLGRSYYIGSALRF